MRRYRANEVTARQALALAEKMAAAAGCRVVWMPWLRSGRWGHWSRPDPLDKWEDGVQTLLLFGAQRDARRYLNQNGIGGDWQIQPYPTTTVEDLCAQNGISYRVVEDHAEPWADRADLIDPETGEVATVPWKDRQRGAQPSARKTKPVDVDLTRIRWRMDRIAQEIAGFLERLGTNEGKCTEVEDQ
jgi:hypothetical protein